MTSGTPVVRRNSTAIPELEFPPPKCPICSSVLDHDDSWYCLSCGVTWDADGRCAMFDDDLLPECGHRGVESLVAGAVCRLEAGHAARLHAGYSDSVPWWLRWNDDGEFDA